MDFGEFEKIINISFKDKNLLRTAFTHRSYLNEQKKSDFEHNERLEFLGDAVLELVVTEYLFDRFPEKPEGELTSLRAALVNATTCARVSGSLNINDFLLLSKGESKDTGRARQIILANTLESVIGAIYLDQGYEVVKDFIFKNVASLTDEILETQSWIDSKSLFQEKAQEMTSVTPSYKVLKEIGPDHDKKFVAGVFLEDEEVAQGEGNSKQEAEQEAAKKALEVKEW